MIKGDRELINYNFKDLLANTLSRADLNINYYSSNIKLPKGYKPSKEMKVHIEVIRKYTRKWASSLEKQGVSYVKSGNLKPRSSKPCTNCGHSVDVLQEKGVDVRIASDMIKDSLTRAVKGIVLLSSDSDLAPALHILKQRNIEITYIYFGNTPNMALQQLSSETFGIPIKQLKKYYQP